MRNNNARNDFQQIDLIERYRDKNEDKSQDSSSLVAKGGLTKLQRNLLVLLLARHRLPAVSALASCVGSNLRFSSSRLYKTKTEHQRMFRSRFSRARALHQYL